jgi:PAS domain S-box-containing protein
MTESVLFALTTIIVTIFSGLMLFIRKTTFARIMALETDTKEYQKKMNSDSAKIARLEAQIENYLSHIKSLEVIIEESRNQIGKMKANIHQLLRLISIEAPSGAVACRFRVSKGEVILGAQFTASEITGYTSDELIGKQVSFIVPSELQSSYRSAIKLRIDDPELKADAAIVRHAKVRHKTKGNIPVNIVIREIYGLSGEKEFIADLVLPKKVESVSTQAS